MANVGDRLLQPEDGWKRIDNTEDKIIYSGSTWNEQTNNDKYYNSTLHYCHTSGGIITIYFYGTSFRLLGKMSSIYTSINKITIDNQPTETFSCYNASITDTDVTATTRILYEVQDLQRAIHKVEIETVAQSGRTYCLVFDCIDINETGRICSEEEYLALASFPVLVGDETVTTEDDVLSYAETLTHGERRLLVALHSLYLTDGQGGYEKLSTGGNGSSINDENISENTTFSSKKIDNDYATKEELNKISIQQASNSLPSFSDPTLLIKL